MRILLDECLPHQLKYEFTNHDVDTVSDVGWDGKTNGELLHLANERGYNVFVTSDKNLKYQQEIKNYKLAVVVLDVRRKYVEVSQAVNFTFAEAVTQARSR